MQEGSQCEARQLLFGEPVFLADDDRQHRGVDGMIEEKGVAGLDHDGVEEFCADSGNFLEDILHYRTDIGEDVQIAKIAFLQEIDRLAAAHILEF